MTKNPQQLKRRIKTSKNIAQIAKALEMIAASKIKKAQMTSSNNRPYADRITEMTGKIINITDKKHFSHPYINEHKSSKKLIIAISPDRGLCGSLNTNIYKKMMEIESVEAKIITIGKKAGFFASKLGFEILLAFPMGSSLPDYSLVYQIKKAIDEQLLNETVSSVYLLYADFVTLFTQQPILKQLLPLNLELLDKNTEDEVSIFEPESSVLLSDLLPYYLEVQIYNALLQAFTSEQAAQMIAMQNAKNNAFDIAEYFTLVYNKSRQERITNEILDLSNSKQV